MRPLGFTAATADGEKRWHRLCAAHGVAVNDALDASLDADDFGMDEHGGAAKRGDVGGSGEGSAEREDGPLGLLGSLPGTEALQVCCALEGACLGAEVAEARRLREELQADFRNHDEIRAVLDSVIEKISKLHAQVAETVG